VPYLRSNAIILAGSNTSQIKHIVPVRDPGLRKQRKDGAITYIQKAWESRWVGVGCIRGKPHCHKDDPAETESQKWSCWQVHPYTNVTVETIVSWKCKYANSQNTFPLHTKSIHMFLLEQNKRNNNNEEENSPSSTEFLKSKLLHNVVYNWSKLRGTFSLLISSPPSSTPATTISLLKQSNTNIYPISAASHKMTGTKVLHFILIQLTRHTLNLNFI
jgi:hypothetical protein